MNSATDTLERLALRIELPADDRPCSTWIQVEGVSPEQLMHLQLHVGSRIAISISGQQQPEHRRLTAGEMLWAIASYAGRHDLAFEYHPRPEERGATAMLHLWLMPLRAGPWPSARIDAS